MKKSAQRRYWHQHAGKDCSRATILNAYRYLSNRSTVHADVHRIVDRLCTNGLGHAGVEDVSDKLNQLRKSTGIASRTSFGQRCSVGRMRSLTKGGGVVACWIRLKKNDSHWILLVGESNGHFSFVDPEPKNESRAERHPGATWRRTNSWKRPNLVILESAFDADKGVFSLGPSIGRAAICFLKTKTIAALRR